MHKIAIGLLKCTTLEVLKTQKKKKRLLWLHRLYYRVLHKYEKVSI